MRLTEGGGETASLVARTLQRHKGRQSVEIDERPSTSRTKEDRRRMMAEVVALIDTTRTILREDFKMKTLVSLEL